MHISDGLLDAPTAVATGAIALGGVGYALRRVDKALEDRTAPLMGVMAACIFAAQMVNFPVGAAASGHLCGGVLAAVMLGPWAGAVAIAVVLVVQCLLFQDGGLSALGANVINLALIGSMIGYCVYALLRRLFGGRAGIAISATIAAWFSAVLSAAAFAVELASSGFAPIGPLLSWMVLVHVVIGVGEAIITGMAVSFVLRTRPDLVYGNPDSASGFEKGAQVVLGGLAIAVVTAVFVAPWASNSPDGFEWVAQSLGSLEQGGDAIVLGPIPDYQFPGIENLKLATSIAGLCGVLTVFAIALGIGRSVRPRATLGNPGHAP